jgi:subtilisin family serine protease
MRQLHQAGITGRGVGIAIIDQLLLVEHQEYIHQLRLYEVADDVPPDWTETSMHGPAVASIAVGKTVGVAPEADLYYIVTNFCNTTGLFENHDYACLAQQVRRILEINELLPKNRKIRVISISVGWGPESIGYAEITAATQAAKDAGMLVICSSVEEVHGFKFHALGREPLADPDQFGSYEPGLWWAQQFYNGRQFSDRLLVPMDSRTTASPGGVDEYVFYRQGGWSWSIPYIAGAYALAAQVKPKITPDEFWQLALQTGQTIELEHDGQVIKFGPILDPASLVTELQK